MSSHHRIESRKSSRSLDGLAGSAVTVVVQLVLPDP